MKIKIGYVTTTPACSVMRVIMEMIVMKGWTRKIEWDERGKDDANSTVILLWGCKIIVACLVIGNKVSARIDSAQK
jgi:hypothetical protein